MRMSNFFTLLSSDIWGGNYIENHVFHILWPCFGCFLHYCMCLLYRLLVFNRSSSWYIAVTFFMTLSSLISLLFLSKKHLRLSLISPFDTSGDIPLKSVEVLLSVRSNLGARSWADVLLDSAPVLPEEFQPLHKFVVFLVCPAPLVLTIVSLIYMASALSHHRIVF